MPAWIDFLLTIIERVTGTVTFPLVTLILVLVFFLRFPKEIKTFLNRSRIRTPWLDQGDLPSANEPRRNNDAPAIAQPQHASPEVAARMEQIRQILDKAGSPDREGVLLQAVAEGESMTFFERVYRLIYASQIRVLRAINGSITGLTRDNLNAYAPPAMKDAAGGVAEWWIGNIVRGGLAEFEGQNVKITDSGKEFLVYITRQGYSDVGLHPEL